MKKFALNFTFRYAHRVCSVWSIPVAIAAAAERFQNAIYFSEWRYRHVSLVRKKKNGEEAEKKFVYFYLKTTVRKN